MKPHAVRACLLLALSVPTSGINLFAQDRPGTEGSATTIPVTIQVDATRNRGPLQPAWRFFGADEPNYAYMKDGKKLLSDLGDLRFGARFTFAPITC